MQGRTPEIFPSVSAAAPLQEPEQESKQEPQLEIKPQPKARPTSEPVYLSGWRFWTVGAALGRAIFLVTLEVTIVSTALVSISNELQAFSQSSWVVTSYLITFSGFLIIFAKLSDIFGRNGFIIGSLCVFIIFSIACGLSNSITQLIVFRAFQGIGASGTQSLTVVMFFELVPPKRFAVLTSTISLIFTIALLAGPLFGGAIVATASWRWIFYLNAPSAAISAATLFLTLPPSSPNHSLPAPVQNSPQTHRFRRLDLIGTALLLCATVSLVVSLEEAGVKFSWGSGFVVGILELSAMMWVLFFAWSWYTTTHSTVREPVLPWRLINNRIGIGLILSFLLAGGPYTVAVIQIPQRFQAVNSLSPLEAGIRLLPYAILNPVGSVIMPILAKKAKIPPVYLLLLGSALQVVGFALLSVLPSSEDIVSATYWYERISAFGVGSNLACLILMTPLIAEKRHRAVAMTAVVQFRTLGGVIGLAIAANVMSSVVRSALAVALPANEVTALLQSTAAFANLSLLSAQLARAAFAQGYDMQMKVLIAFSIAQIPASLLLWKKKQILVVG